MKKFLKSALGVAAGLALAAGAQAATVEGTLFGGNNQLSDNSAEELINVAGNGATAVERERTIAENELQSRIELAKREELLVKQEGANAQKRATEAAAVKRVETTARAESTRMLGIATAGRRSRPPRRLR